MTYDPHKITQAGDALNRGIAMVNTIWLALERAETEEDISQAADTLAEAQSKLLEAQKLIGLHRPHDGRNE